MRIKLRPRTLVLLSLTALMALPATTWARPGRHGGGPPFGRALMMLGHLADELEITEEQRAAIREALGSQRDGVKGVVEQMVVARRSLRQQIHAETFDEGAIRQASAEVAAFEEELAVARALAFQEIQKILTPEQIAEARQIIEERRARFEERGGRRGGRFGSPFGE